VFVLRRADATATYNLLLNLFSGTARAGAGATPGGFGAPGGFGTPGATTANQTVRPLLTLTGAPSEGATLIDLRIAPDARTNTLIVAGSQNDLDTINAIIARLDDAETPQLRTEVYKLRNANAADVATALTSFINS